MLRQNRQTRREAGTQSLRSSGMSCATDSGVARSALSALSPGPLSQSLLPRSSAWFRNGTFGNGSMGMSRQAFGITGSQWATLCLAIALGAGLAGCKSSGKKADYARRERRRSQHRYQQQHRSQQHRYHRYHW